MKLSDNDANQFLMLTLPWGTQQTTTNCIEFLDKAGEATGLQLMNANGEDISACDLQIADFILQAINSQKQLTEVRAFMRYLDARGGLGSDNHAWLRRVTPLPRPPHPEHCRTFEECALAGRCRANPTCID